MKRFVRPLLAAVIILLGAGVISSSAFAAQMPAPEETDCAGYIVVKEKPTHDEYCLMQSTADVQTLPDGGFVVVEDYQQACALAERIGADYVEPDYYYRMLDGEKKETASPADNAKAWKTIRAAYLAENGIYGTDRDLSYDMGGDGECKDPIVVGVIDSGFCAEHADIDPTHILPGINFYKEQNPAIDEDGHGTFVTGIILSGLDNGIGINGLAPECYVMPLKVFEKSLTSTSIVVSAVQYAAEQKALFNETNGAEGINFCVLNMSLGSSQRSKLLKSAVESAINEGIIVIGSAGNDGTTRESYPAQFAIGVGTTDADGSLKNSSYTQILSAVNGEGYRNKVWVSAPGTDYTSTYCDGKYYVDSGTSFSAPQITALAALALSIRNDLTQCLPEDAVVDDGSGNQITVSNNHNAFKALLQKTANLRDFGSGKKLANGQDIRYGWGVADFGALLRRVSTPADELIVTVTGYAGEEIVVDGVKFDPDADFNGATTTYQQNLARESVIFSMVNGSSSQGKATLREFGFENVRSYDYKRTASSPAYQNGYYLATREITRSGKPCTLVLLNVHTNSNGDSMAENFDFLNQETTGASTNYQSDLALTFTESAGYILSSRSGAVQKELDALQSAYESSGKDYLIWVSGTSRGGAVGNYLAKLLVDRYGTNHVMAYLTGVPNVDKNALGPENTSKYNCIFNILNPDDVVTYVPFDKNYSGWGFGRWGVDVYLKAPATDGALATALQNRFGVYTANANSYFDGTYYYYDSSLCNGTGVRNVLDGLVNGVAPSIQDYYKTSVALKQYSLLSVTAWAAGSARGGASSLSTAYKTPYALFKQVMGTDFDSTTELLSLYRIAQGSYYNDCGITELLQFALLHAAGASDLDTFAKALMDGSESFVFHEALVAHATESYLALVSVYRDGVSVERDVLPDAAAEDVRESGGVSVTTDKGFYSDQTFTASTTADGCSVSLTSGGADSVPYDAAMVSIPEGSIGQDAQWAIYSGTNGHTELIPVVYSSGYYDVPLMQLNGTVALKEIVAATATLTYADGHSKTASYVPSSVGSSLPSDSKASDTSYDYTFKGWQFSANNAVIKDGESETATALSLKLFVALNNAREKGYDITATSVFTQTEKQGSGGSGSGGSSGGGGGAGGGGGIAAAPTAERYAVTAEKTEHGTVSADVTEAASGDLVTLTLKAEEGYELSKLTVTDESGAAVATTKVSQSVYTFVMPEGKVSISVEFTAAQVVSVSFADVSDTDWYASAVRYAVKNKLMNGVSETSFAPSATTTRGMIFTVLARRAGVDTTLGSVWYETGMNWAMAQGISDGTNPTGNITREQLAAMLYRTAQSAGQGFTGASMFYFNPVDLGDISSWAMESMRWCYMKGVLTGDQTGALNPKGEATRAEVAKMLMVFCEAMAQ